MSFITLEEAKSMVERYRQQRTEILKPELPVDILPISLTFPKDEVIKLISQEGCSGLRIYLGSTEENLITTILVATDEKNQDIIPETDYILLDKAARCPTICELNSPLAP